MDNYPVKSDTEPVNLMFRDKTPVTVMQMVLNKDIPVTLKNLDCDIKALIVSGLVGEFCHNFSF